MRSDAGTIDYLIDDLGGVNKAARICGVHRSTIYRWIRGAVPVPQAAYRALYAASSWGREERSTHTANGIRQRADYIATLEAQIRQRDAELSRVLRLAGFGCANAPIYRMIRRSA
jgi:hypothetical protein